MNQPPQGYPPQGHYPQPQGYPPQQQMQQYQHAPQHTPPAGPRVDARMQDAISQIDLLAGEQIVYTLTADGFFIGVQPILKLMAAIASLVATLTGGHIRIYLLVTNQRVLVIKSVQVWCGFNRMKEISSVALAGIKEVGSAKDTQMCCIHTRRVRLQSMTETFNFVVKKLPDSEIRAFVTNLSAVVVAHTSRASI
jgi:hypothetical protein